MAQREIRVTNPTGFHARPASLLVARACKSKSKVTIFHGGKAIDGKSMLQVMGAEIQVGSLILLVVEGEDERTTLSALCRLIRKLPE